MGWHKSTRSFLYVYTTPLTCMSQDITFPFYKIRKLSPVAPSLRISQNQILIPELSRFIKSETCMQALTLLRFIPLPYYFCHSYKFGTVFVYVYVYNQLNTYDYVY